jgi:hypothetical protein
MTLRSYDTSGSEWEITDEPCQNCGAPVWKNEVVGLHPEGAAHFGTAYACPACDSASPSRKPLEELRRMLGTSEDE